jgi:hypothetical protein
MSRYLRLNIDQGTYQGQPVISQATASQMQSPQSAEGKPMDYVELEPGSYGLGVHVNHYRGHKLVYHGGGIDGFFSSLSWMLDDQIGVVVLTNSCGNVSKSGVPPVYTIIARAIFDRLLGLPAMDWIARGRQWQRNVQMQLTAVREKEAAERIPGTSPTHSLAAYAGSYEHPGYGLITIAEQGGQLMLALDHLTVSLEHFHYDVFKTVPPKGGAWQWGIGAARRVTFSYGESGRIDRVEVSLEPAVSDIVFKRRSESI